MKRCDSQHKWRAAIDGVLLRYGDRQSDSQYIWSVPPRGLTREGREIARGVRISRRYPEAAS